MNVSYVGLGVQAGGVGGALVGAGGAAYTGAVPRAEIVAPSSGWPAEFAEIATALRSALGGLALRIDHIGSTAVPGLAAKDVVDIQVTVAALDAAALTPEFARA